jgi:hypothetical protein
MQAPPPQQGGDTFGGASVDIKVLNPERLKYISECVHQLFYE